MADADHLPTFRQNALAENDRPAKQLEQPVPSNPARAGIPFKTEETEEGEPYGWC
jgi:hypothetical protein